MPRPCKRRRICREPYCECFGPLDQSKVKDDAVMMTLDEFEAIRLIDLNDLTQEQCAEQMNVARTTAQAIYMSARRKLADALVNARNLCIEGGDYVFCDGSVTKCKGHGSSRCRQPDVAEKEKKEMKIAVTYDNGQIFQHFGHTEYFKIYTVENYTVKDAVVLDTNGSGHGALAGFLKDAQVDVLICGGIGGGARQALAQAGIILYGGVAGDADAAVAALLQDALNYDPNARCDHHHGDHHGNCGSHSCGSHTCGH